MEMATQAKTKTKTTATATTTTTAKVKVKAATGNGNPYTQNISTVKEQQQDVEKIKCFAESSTETQNNKTEIKISKSKQRNYLKFLINLYLKLKLILCISQINKSILKILKTKTKTKTHTNYSKTTKPSTNVEQICNINLKQQQQKQQLIPKTASFKTISFKFKLVINFLTKFNNYCSSQRKNLENYVKILIKNILHNKKIRNFVGICPKRLISLKRLQQIPENHKKLDDDTNSLRSRNYSNTKELQLWQHIQPELSLSKECKLIYGKKNYRTTKQELQQILNKLLSWPEKESSMELSKSNYPSTKELQLWQNIQPELPLSKECKLSYGKKNYNSIKKELQERKDSSKELSKSRYYGHFNGTYNKIIRPLRQFKETHTRFILEETKTLENSYKNYKPISEKPAESMTLTPNKNSKLLRLKEAVPDNNNDVLNSCNKYEKKYFKFNETSLQKNNLNQTKIDVHSNFRNIEEIKGEIQNSLNKDLENADLKCKQVNKHRVVLQHNTENTNQIKLLPKSKTLTDLPENMEISRKKYSFQTKTEDFVLQQLLANSPQKCGQPKKHRVAFAPNMANEHQVKFENYKENYSLLRKHKDSELQEHLQYSPEKCGQLNQHRDAFDHYMDNEEQKEAKLQKLLQYSSKKRRNTLKRYMDNEKKKENEKCGQLIKHRVALKREIVNFDETPYKCQRKYPNLNENQAALKPQEKVIDILQNSQETKPQNKATLNQNFRNHNQLDILKNTNKKCSQLETIKRDMDSNIESFELLVNDNSLSEITDTPQNSHKKFGTLNYTALDLITTQKFDQNSNKKSKQLKPRKSALSFDQSVNVKTLTEVLDIPQNSFKKFGTLNQTALKLIKTERSVQKDQLLKNNKNSSKTLDFKTVSTQTGSSNMNGLLKSTTHSPFQRVLANNTNSAKEIVWHNNNSYKNSRHSRHKESKQQECLKKCQHFLYSIFLYYCCCCSWHIYGFPLVLVKIFKYLKDSTVHVLTRRLKISTTTIAAARITFSATSIDYSFGNVIAACGGKLKKPTKVADYKANIEQNIFKRQTTHITADKITTKAIGSCAYSSSCCSTKSLTASPENLILLQQQKQPSWTPYCHYQQHQPHHQQQKLQTQQQLQQQKQQQPQRYHQPLSSYNFCSTFHLQLPSLLVFSRTLIILILLSSLWHTSEGFHGSGVKLSTNTVKTKYGLVRGIVVRSSPSLVEAYLGIPYASPPVGSLRFMPPITPSTWKNVRNADRFSPVCPQNVPIPPNGPEALLEVPRARLAQLRRLLPLLSNQSEDCLYLNIYVPYEHRRHRRFTTNSGELNDSPKLPTILFIHGESYEWNSGNPYDGSELAAHGNVIVVTINFRLGILGFLKTGGKESAQGNFGLMDLVAGLHWLKENLPAFGGDPQAITLLGHGTGAALANILVVSPVASDLVQHTVMVSGSALSPWAIQKNPLFVKRRVAEQTGCHGDMLYYDLAPCLRTKSVADLLAVKIDHPRFLVGFAPFIDGTVISPNTDSIGKLSLPLGSAIVSTSGIEYANFPKRNLIFCLTSVESHLDLSAQDLEFGFNETRRDRILRTYVRNNFHYHLNEIFAVLKNEYTDWDKAIRSPLSSRDATLQFLSDGHTASSLIKLGYMHSLRGGRGYFLHFKHRTVEEEYPQRTGSVRGEDVPFWLGLPISPLFPHNYTTQEKQISRLMLRYLANFAKTGNPNQSSLSSPLPSSSSLIGSPPSASSSSSSQTADDPHEKVKRSSFNIVNATSSSSSGPIKSNAIVVDVATAAAREALNLAVLYNQRRTKRTYYKRHSRSNDDHSGSASSEVNYFLSTNNNNNNNNKLDSDELPFWDAYDVVNQLYMELGNKAEIQSHYRGHKLSMWLNLIPQLHRHANMNDQSMRHHQFQDDLNNLNLYEGIVRAQIQTKPDDDDETLLLPKGRPTPPPPPQETNTTLKPNAGTTECGVDGAMFVAEMTTAPPSDNRSLVLDSREKEMATASTGLIGNLEVLRRLSGKQFQSYTTALVATVAVGCFLLVLNILIFAGIYHQREKRARDAKTKEELQDNDTSKNSSMLKLNAMGSETGSFNGSGAGVSGKTTVVFGEYSCYDEKSLQTKDEKLIVELPPPQMLDPNWAACSTSTLDLLKTKHHNPLENTYTLSNVVPINTESQTEHLMAINAMEMVTYNPLPMTSGLIIDPTLAATSSSGLLSKRGSFVGSAGQLNQYDFASVQSSDQMSFKDIENAVKASATMDDDITQDDDIPEPPPPPRSFHSMQQQQQHQGAANMPPSASGSGGGGGILRQAGTTSATQTGGGKKRVHIQEISV